MDDSNTSSVFPLDSIWSIESTRFDNMISSVDAARLSCVVPNNLHIGEQHPRVENGVAVIEIDGVMTKKPSMFQVLFGGSATATIQQQVEQAAGDDAVKAILLKVDSPGGSVDGLAELGDAVFAARQIKPVVAQITGMGASAAYYVASQADKVFAQRMDLVGSIGTRLMLYDLNRLFENAGVTAIPVDTGKFKSAGAAGTRIEEEHKTYFQSIVDAFFDDFVAVVARGRKLSAAAVRSVADGRIFPAADAAAQGLIDGIQTFEQTLSGLLTQVNKSGGRSGNPKSEIRNPKSSMEVQPMSQENTQVEPATLAEIKHALPDSDAAFQVKCLESGWTLEKCKDAWIEQQKATLEAKDAELVKAQKATQEPSGVEPLGHTPADSATSGSAQVGDARERFGAAVLEKMQQCGGDRQRAVSAVINEDPDLHQAFLIETNPGRRARRLIEEKFDLGS